MVPEAPLEENGAGLAPTREGWFVLNARDARWRDRPGRGLATPFEGEYELPQVGVRLYVLGRGEPMGMYHWEAGQEDFLVVSGEGVLLVEGEERPLRQWDLVHCPPGTKHMIVGGPCVVVATGARGFEQGGVWGGYSPDEAAARHGVSVERETSDAEEAYAKWADVEPTRYRDGLLP